MKKNNKIYFVEWQDAHSNSGWFSKVDLERFIKRDRCICQEVGWILHEDKDEIIMASRKIKWKDDFSDCEYGMLQKIPKAWIRKKKIYKTDGK